MFAEPLGALAAEGRAGGEALGAGARSPALKTEGAFWLTTFIVRWPLLALLLLLAPAVALGVVGLLNPISFDVGVSAFSIRQSHFSQQREAALHAALREENNYPTYQRRRQLQVTSHWRAPTAHAAGEPAERSSILDRLELIMFYRDGRNMLTPEGVARARSVEQAVASFPGYQDWCPTNPALFGDHCSPPNSVTTYFYPSVTAGSAELQYDGRGEEIVDFAGTRDALAVHTPAQWFLDDSGDHTASTLLRMEISFAQAGPISVADKARYGEWVEGMVPLLAAQTTDDFVCTFGGEYLTRYLVRQALWEDLDFILISGSLVLGYTVWHTGSLPLSVLSLLMISLSFPVAFFFYFSCYATDESNKVGLLNVMGVYVTLGIGVDDCYVFLAAFEQCADSASVEVQLGRAWRRAGKAMLTTSATTALAFLANMVSSIPVILSFSVFMSTLVIINYVFVITIFPAILMVHNRYLSRCRGSPCNRRAADRSDGTGSGAEHPLQDLGTAQISNPSFGALGATAEPAELSLEASGGFGESAESDKAVENMWRWQRFGRRGAEHAHQIVGAMCVLLLAALGVASRLSPSQDLPQLFKSDHNIQQFLDLKNYNISGSQHCSTCAAAYSPEFKCTEQCTGGSTCRYGLCYNEDGDIEASCAPQMLSVSSACAAVSMQTFGVQQTAQLMGGGVAAFLGLDADAAPDPSGCVDTYKDCVAWSREAQCISNQAFMWRNCPASCDRCAHNTRTESGMECFDSIDNDHDRRLDCQDNDCRQSVPFCSLSRGQIRELRVTLCTHTSCVNALRSFVDDCQAPEQKAAVQALLAEAQCPDERPPPPPPPPSSARRRRSSPPPPQTTHQPPPPPPPLARPPPSPPPNPKNHNPPPPPSPTHGPTPPPSSSSETGASSSHGSEGSLCGRVPCCAQLRTTYFVGCSTAEDCTLGCGVETLAAVASLAAGGKPPPPSPPPTAPPSPTHGPTPPPSSSSETGASSSHPSTHRPPPPPPPPASVDCAGAWSSCNAQCERTWVQTAAPVGPGRACPPALPCHEGDDACPYQEGCHCGGHGTCATGHTECVCAPLYKGRSCEECSMSGATFPDCGAAAVEAAAAAAPPTQASANDNKLPVSIVWGLNERVTKDADGVAHFSFAENSETWFDVAQPECQLYIREICSSLRTDASSLGLQPVVKCWADDFAAWDGLSGYPVPAEDFVDRLKAFLGGAGAAHQQELGFERVARGGGKHITRLAWFRLIVFSEDMPRYAAGFRALPLFNELEKVVNFAINKRGDLPAGIGSEAGVRSLRPPPTCLRTPAFQTSELWPRMYTEVTAVNGTVWAIAIIGISALLTVLLFTASPRVAACVIINISGILTCVLAFFVLAGWSLGIVEAVSISILLGSSVDYSLHIADAYIECCKADDTEQHLAVATLDAVASLDAEDDAQVDDSPAARRRQRRRVFVQQALARIGGSVLHASITTFLSVIALVGCVVRIFVEFGMIIAASVLSSIAFALVALPALLMLLGPAEIEEGQAWRRRAVSLGCAVAVLCSIYVGLLVADWACDGCIPGPGGRPLFHSLGQDADS